MYFKSIGAFSNIRVTCNIMDENDEFLNHIRNATKQVEYTSLQFTFECSGCEDGCSECMKGFIPLIYDKSQLIKNDPEVSRLFEEWSQWNQYWCHGWGSSTMYERLVTLFHQHRYSSDDGSFNFFISDMYIIVIALAHHFNAMIRDKHHPVEPPPLVFEREMLHTQGSILQDLVSYFQNIQYGRVVVTGSFLDEPDCSDNR